VTGGYEHDVTPVAGAAGSRAHRPGAGTHLPPEHDPFGARPSVHRRGWVRIVLGALLLIAGAAALAVGILQAVRHREAIDANAVARGTIRAGEPGRPLAFRVPPGERRRYTVYLLFGGVESNSTVQELAVRDTGCLARMPDGVLTRFRGARQTLSETIGDAASVGTFSSQPGPVAIVCRYTSGTRGSQRRRPGAVPYLVTAGGQSLASGGMLAIGGGVLAGTAGGLLVGWGLRGRRTPVR
jgi:hypothetical protein